MSEVWPEPDEAGMIELGRVLYDTRLRRIVLEPNEAYGIGQYDDAVEIFGYHDATSLGIQIQALAQILPQNEAASAAVNEVYRVALRDQQGDHTGVMERAAQAGRAVLDEESPDRSI